MRLCSDHLFGVEKNRSKTAKWTFAAMHSGEKPNNRYQISFENAQWIKVEKNRSKTPKWTFAAMHSGEKPNNR